ncbi:hypothetical protein Goshw_014104 [Gossypium schwendimanii]|uniref:Myb/SANT-like domain-containing protein n=1 Tax=Gossypium schwendimanii TaxID=34291 RepID=A0A7J9LW73_GOSSC|nr:hypothetical protein [Gossypium schwendimanii]
MTRLPLIVQNERRKRIDLTLIVWLQMCTVANYVKRLVHASDETCIEQVRMNRVTFFKLCEMLQTLGGLKSLRNMLVDEQNCLDALDGTYIKIRVPKVGKPRYRMRKGDIATNMLGFCTPNSILFIFFLVGKILLLMDGFFEMSKWVPEEDAALVACMVDLHNVGTFNANTGFKAGYLNKMERMLEKVLPYAMLKAKPNLESRIRILKRDWAIVYDMLRGKNNSDFGWDEHRQFVSHKEADQFRHRSFPYYDQLTTIYTKDRATGKDAQIVVDIIEKIDAEDVVTANTHEKRNDFHGCEADVSLVEMDLLTTQPQPSRN